MLETIADVGQTKRIQKYNWKYKSKTCTEINAKHVHETNRPNLKKFQITVADLNLKMMSVVH